MNAANLKLSVLIVEDDVYISSSIRELLEDNDYEVFSAPNGQAALNLLKKSAPPSLILLDLMMPVMDGFEFRQKQLADPTLTDIPVVIMSADGHVEEKRARTAASDYLKKPVDIFTLLRTVEKFALRSS